MFELITPAMHSRMKALEAIDLRDRIDGTPHSKRLRQVPQDAARFITILAASTPAGSMLEIGTSAGYSTLWLSLAARATHRQVTTFEIDPHKVELARTTFAGTQTDDVIDLIHGDALVLLPNYTHIAFCFLDAEKDIYAPCYDLIVPRLVPGGLLIADNAISHERELRPMLDRALADDRLDSVLVPIGTGDLVCRKK